MSTQRTKSLIDLGVTYFVVSCLFDWREFRAGTLASITYSVFWKVLAAVIFVLLWTFIAPLIVPQILKTHLSKGIGISKEQRR